jgi:hypothetical protein
MAPSETGGCCPAVLRRPAETSQLRLARANMWRSLTLAIRVAAATAEDGYRLPVDLVPGSPIPRYSILLHCAAILNGGPMTSAERAECGE